MKRLGVLSVLLGAVVFAGCGGGSSSSTLSAPSGPPYRWTAAEVRNFINVPTHGQGDCVAYDSQAPPPPGSIYKGGLVNLTTMDCDCVIAKMEQIYSSPQMMRVLDPDPAAGGGSLLIAADAECFGARADYQAYPGG